MPPPGISPVTRERKRRPPASAPPRTQASMRRRREARGITSSPHAGANLPVRTRPDGKAHAAAGMASGFIGEQETGAPVHWGAFRDQRDVGVLNLSGAGPAGHLTDCLNQLSKSQSA